VGIESLQDRMTDGRASIESGDMSLGPLGRWFMPFFGVLALSLHIRQAVLWADV